MGSITERFDSINQFMSVIGSRKNNVGMGDANHSHSSDKSFTGTESWEEACDQLRNGWDKHLDKVKKEFGQAKVKTNVSASRQRVATGVVGYAPLVPNAIKGLPNSMLTAERIPQKVKAVSIVYAQNVSCGWSARQLVECGIAVLKIVNQLELEGYRVKLMIEPFASHQGKDHLRCLVSVKDWRQPIDLKKLCFPLISPSMFRRFGFRWLETVPNMNNSDFRCGYGTPLCDEGQYPKDLETAKKDGVIGDNDYFLSAYMIKENNHDVKKIMEQAGMTCLK